MQAVMPGIHTHKIDAVRRNIPLADGDPLLLEAYQHKIEGGSRRLVRHQRAANADRSEEHTSELQSLMRISYAVFCLKKKKKQDTHTHSTQISITQTNKM